MSEATRNRKRAEVAERVARAQQQQQQALLAAAALASLTLVRHDDGKSEWAFAEREPRKRFTPARDAYAYACIRDAPHTCDARPIEACAAIDSRHPGTATAPSACMPASLRALEAKGASYPRRWWMGDKAKDAIAAELKRSNFCMLDNFLGAAAMKNLRAEVSERQSHNIHNRHI